MFLALLFTSCRSLSETNNFWCDFTKKIDLIKCILFMSISCIFFSCTCKCMSETYDFYFDFTKFLFTSGNVKLAYCFSVIVGHVDNGHPCMNPSFEKLMKMSL